ncbi:hypothetical protein ACD591_17770 [Rufibacter glacialis]|uniref:Uncharacterized protein n=1 Tax=Rufibacter glacialis TaxID=1259555 RepID=A0ABV4RK69_9BACT|nr:hypothetical protein [Rufibacter glacialis]GGK85871.1 hypothetical protein GCM10011405_37130 [Rufibacter glacialis]
MKKKQNSNVKGVTVLIVGLVDIGSWFLKLGKILKPSGTKLQALQADPLSIGLIRKQAEEARETGSPRLKPLFRKAGSKRESTPTGLQRIYTL